MTNSHIKLSDWIFADTPEPAGLTLPDAAVAYWKLDEASGNAIDSVGSYTLAENGTVPSDVDGLFGNCRGGFSSSNYLASTGLSSGGSADDPDFDVSTGSTWYLDCFIKPYATTNSFVQMPICAMNRDTGLRYDYDASGGYSLYGLNTSSSQVYNDSLDPVPDYVGDWTHVIVAKTGEGGSNELILLINGVLVDSADSSGYAYIHGEFTVGKRNSSTAYPATTIKICDLLWAHGLTSETVPGTGTLTERLTAIAVDRYNGGAGKQYTIS